MSTHASLNKVLIFFVGALAVWEVPVEDSNLMHRSIVIDEVRCDSTETELLDCSHTRGGYYGIRCSNGGDAGVRDVEINGCKLRISLLLPFKHHTVMLQDKASYSPGSCTIMHHTHQIHFR